jgi:hypothetical protein
MANYLAASGRGSADELYQAIMAMGFPKHDDAVRDWWDSPERHRQVIRKLTGSEIGLCEPTGNCVVLLRMGMKFHWVTYFGSGNWHDGKSLSPEPWKVRWPEVKVVMAYKIDGPWGFPWWNWPWWMISRVLVFLFK